MHASPEQFSIMLDYMERNGDLSRPQPGAQGRLSAEHHWNKLTELLNSVGGSGVQRQSDKWKRVWSDWKTKTKKKASLIHRDTQGTGGGPSRARTLNPLEERVLRIIGLGSITRHQELPEAGFQELPPPSYEPIVRTPSPSRSAPPVPSPARTSRQLVLPSTHETHNMEVLNVASTHHDVPLSFNIRRQEDAVRSHSAGPSTPRRRRVRGQRRRRQQTPLEQATSEFVRVEEGRLRLEETRIKQQYEREMERLRLESLRIAMDQSRNDIEQSRNYILQKLADIANNVMELLSNSGLVRD